MGTLPTGTVTFLFTDIEGRGKWEEMRGRHNAILESAIESHNGYVFQIIGDAFCASFHTAGDAVRAAAQAQIDFHKEDWGKSPVRVRMGINTGTAQASIDTDHSGGYKGYTAMARVQRLMSAGHGGQVLISLATEELVHDDLPENISLRDMGECRLKDLIKPERIYQLVIPNLPADFPPIKTLDIYHHNLPIQMTSFIGRGMEVEQITNSIRKHRLVTLTGPGGTGKTRLSLQVAADLVDAFPNGVWYVELETVESPNYLVSAIARELQFSIDAHSSDLDPKRQLLDYLGKQTTLLVLDNFEHLVEEADLLTDILKVSAETRLMVTSRERLNLQEEWVYPISGLRYPQNGNGSDIEAYSGLKLFVERARQVKPGFDLASDDIPAVCRICQLVEGLPLGVELAAAWVEMLPCKEIVAEIEGSMDFLATNMRGVPDKHRSLRAVFDQTWQRLTEVQQAGFRKLAVFQGGFGRDAAKSIAGVSLPMLSEFAQKSLIRQDERGRFKIHALLKAFAEEKLNEVTEEMEAVLQNHRQYYVQFLADRRYLIQGERVLEAREEVRAESGNIWVAINGVVTHWDEDQAYNALLSFGVYAQTEGFHTAGGLYQRLAQRLREQGATVEPDAPRNKLLLNVLMGQAFNEVTIGDPDSEALLQSCLPALRGMDLPYELGLALLGLGIWSEYRSEYSEAIQTLEESLSLLKASKEDPFAVTACLTWLGWAHYELGEYDRAGEHFQDAYQVCMEHGNILGLPYVLSKLGTWADALREYKKGLDYHREALKYFEAVGDQAGQGYAYSRMSLSAWGMGDYEKALEVGRAGYEQFHAIGHRWGSATTLCRIGFAETALGSLNDARAHFYEGLEFAIENNYPSVANYALIGLAGLWSEEGEIGRAVEILTLAIEQASTPLLYREIAQRKLTDLESKMPPDSFAEAQSNARSSEYDVVVEKIRQTRISARE